MKEFHEHLIAQMNKYEQTLKYQMSSFLESFDDSINSGDNCDAAIYAIIDFANATGIALQHIDFYDFSSAMTDSTPFVLGK